MARKKKRSEPNGTCCLISEMLEEMGLDRARARALRRQVLEGVILLCRWQLERLSETPATKPRRKRARKVVVD